MSRGALYMTASALSFSVMSALVKVVSARLPTGEIVFARAAITLALSYLLVRRAGLSPWGQQRGALLSRGLLGFAGLTAFYIAIVRLPLADATVLQNSTPLLTAVLAWWLLDEAIGWPTAVAIACGIAGVLIIARPTGGTLDAVGVAAAMSGVVASSFAYVTVRKLSRTEHPLVIVLYFPLVAAPLTLPWMLASFVVPGPLDAALLIALGTATQCGQVFLTKGLAIERAGRAMTINYLQVAFAMLWQLVLFGVWPSPWTLAGASLILGGTLLVAQVMGRSWARGRAGAADSSE